MVTGETLINQVTGETLINQVTGETYITNYIRLLFIVTNYI